MQQHLQQIHASLYELKAREDGNLGSGESREGMNSPFTSAIKEILMEGIKKGKLLFVDSFNNTHINGMSFGTLF